VIVRFVVLVELIIIAVQTFFS